MVFQKIKEVQGHPKIRVLTNAEIEKIDGQPGLLDVTIKTNGSEETFRVGAVVLAAGCQALRRHQAHQAGLRPLQ